MIYNRYGCRVTIHANCGKYMPAPFKYYATLLRCTVTFGDGEQESNRERYLFAEYLNATDGFDEVVRAVGKAPKEELGDKMLAHALEEAL